MAASAAISTGCGTLGDAPQDMDPEGLQGSTGNGSGSPDPDDSSIGSGSGSPTSNGTGSGSSASGNPTTPGGTAAPGTTAFSPAFACDTAARPPAEALRRLTMTQYRNTVKELATWATGADVAVLDAVDVALDALPVDHREAVPQDIHGSYRRLDQTVQQEHVDGYYAAGQGVAKELTSSAAFGKVVGACATDADASNDAQCLDDFIATFGERALRHPLSAEESDFYRSVYGDDTTASAGAYADVITVMLNAPSFVYFVEHGGQELAEQPGVYEVTGPELASRLAYQVWQTGPDAELLQAGADGSILNSAVFDAQVDRLLADPKARATINEFVEDWLKVEDLPPLDGNANDPVFQAFTEGIHPDAALRQAMIDDVVGMVGYYTWQQPAGVDTLLLSDLSFTKDATLAALYGVPVWDGSSTPPAFSAGKRPGLFTRALFLSTGTANTRPVMKGVFLRKRVLCDDIPAPPAGAMNNLPELSPDLTTREVIEAITETPGSNCAGCHSQIINPLGFATENFDSLGRERAQQRLFDDTGIEIGVKPVDTKSVPQVLYGDKAAVDGPLDLMQQMVASGKVEACFARNYFRFTFARWENLAVDGCTLESLRTQLSEGGTFSDVFKAVLKTPAFRRRAFE